LAEKTDVWWAELDDQKRRLHAQELRIDAQQKVIQELQKDIAMMRGP